MLQRTEYVPSRKSAPGTFAARVASGGQPTGAALPQLLPDGMTPDCHSESAMRLMHPVALPPERPTPIAYALDRQSEPPDAVNYG